MTSLHVISYLHYFFCKYPLLSIRDMSNQSLFPKMPDKSTDVPLKISLKLGTPATPSSDTRINTISTSNSEQSGQPTLRISFKRSYESPDDGLASGPVTPASVSKSKLVRSESIKSEDLSPMVSDSDEDNNEDDGLLAGDVSGGHKPRWAPRRARTLHDVLRRLIRQLIKLDRYGFFLEPVDITQVPDYLDSITRPMDLGTMRTKTERKQYSSLDDFQIDFDLIINNCKSYNGPGNPYYKEADRLKGYSVRFFEKARESVDQLPQPEQKLEPLVDVEMDHEDDSSSKSSLLLHQSQNINGLTDKKHKTPVALYKKGPNGGYLYTSLQKIEYAADGSRLMGAREMAILPAPSLSTRYVHSLGASLSSFMSSTASNVLARSAQTLVPDCIYLGPYSTYGPSFDSSQSSLSFNDAHFVNLAVGDIDGLVYASSLRRFVDPLGDSMKQHVDRILDMVTLGCDSMMKTTIMDDVKPTSVMDTLQDELKEFLDIVIDESVVPEDASAQFQFLSQLDFDGLTNPVQKKLNICAQLLFELQNAQGLRLLSREKSISEKEQQITDELKKLFTELLSIVPLSDVANQAWLKEAMEFTLNSCEPIFRGSLPNGVQSQATPVKQ